MNRGIKLQNVSWYFNWKYPKYPTIYSAHPGIYILEKIWNFAKIKNQKGETLPELNIDIYSKFDQYYRYDIIMYDFIHIIQFLIPA